MKALRERKTFIMKQKMVRIIGLVLAVLMILTAVVGPLASLL